LVGYLPSGELKRAAAPPLFVAPVEIDIHQSNGQAQGLGSNLSELGISIVLTDQARSSPAEPRT
jgi:hypothetical protein